VTPVEAQFLAGPFHRADQTFGGGQAELRGNPGSADGFAACELVGRVAESNAVLDAAGQLDQAGKSCSWLDVGGLLAHR